MPVLPDDERLLYRALALAEGAAAFASPNPAVGCVLALHGETLGEGAHRYDLRDHAEIAALKDAETRGNRIAGATAYVTLEPCSHHGRTAPCADSLVAAGIARCVVATVDPNPLVRGAGLKKLRAAGVDTCVAEANSAIGRAARRLNDAFAFSIQHGRPFVTLKAAVSADGKLAPPPGKRLTGAPHWLTGPAARADVQKLRHRSDVLLTGVGTVLADDPAMTERTGQPRRRRLLRAVLDSTLRTPLDSRLVRSAEGDLLLFATEEASSERETAFRNAGIEVIRLPVQGGRVPLDLVLGTLAAIPARSVMVEAGAALNGSLLAAGLVDQLVIYQAPVELGPHATGPDAAGPDAAGPDAVQESLPFAQGQPGPETWMTRLSGVERERFARDAGEDVRVSGYLHDPWIDV